MNLCVGGTLDGGFEPGVELRFFFLLERSEVVSVGVGMAANVGAGMRCQWTCDEERPGSQRR